MKKSVTPYANQQGSKKKQVTKMFDGISSNYDFLNRIISLGIDIKWRNRVVEILMAKKPNSILDIATGTGDLALALYKTRASRIVGLDISPGMLAKGKDKVNAQNLENTIEMVLGDSEALKYKECSFDAVTVAFGVRNFENLELGLSELFRVLKSEGTLVILETAVPTKFPFKQGYSIYTKFLVPLMGKLFTRDQAAYKYLSDSAAVFPHGKQFNNILKKIGFIEVEDRPQTLGVASIYCATKP
ncbi:MAG: bifunctional demethylmenaquinone methyltransferase/2-methoxy-6-polyprenyl-1,4-benzoquinol methylase UbiE [Flavobacteriales bacterium]|nr:bifunctional demethylmenaquinone methyltransferase/2-methoxy-6-polyprenyl-1,4-benzoquinol methylase UbiE [Candidatus Arcticimaribacter sp.]